MTQLGEYIKMALMNIWANKVRTLLTMLGIIIGISSVILIISIGRGATNLISTTLGDIGQGQIAFMVLKSEDKYMVNDEDLDHIRALPGVKAVATQEAYPGNLSTKRGDFEANLYALNSDGLLILDNDYVYGRAYNDSNADISKGYAIIGEESAISMFGSTNVCGMEFSVKLNGKLPVKFTVCGVAKAKDKGGVVSMLGLTPSVEIYTHPKVISRQLGISDESEYDSFYVLKDGKADSQILCNGIIAYLESKHNAKGKDAYMFSSFDDIMNKVNSVVNLITAFVSFVASISLLVGGIGVMNIMLVSVTERTREIGIRKALGAKTGSITVQFLAESAFITLIGGLIGILFGIGGAFLIARIISAYVPNMEFTPSLSLKTVLLASLFSTAVGLFFGIYPARKAAKLSPIEALRQE